MKILCKACQINKDKTEFSISNLKYCVYKCKRCASAYSKLYRDKNKEIINSKIRQWYKKNKIKVKETKTKYLSKNKKIISERSKKYRKQNKEKIKLQQQKYYLNNKNKILNAVKVYSSKNKDTLNKSKKLYYKNKRTVDVKFKIRSAVSANINYYLHNKGLSKNKNSVVNHLPYSIQELKQHLENLFEPWMNWGNYGKYDSKNWDDNNSSTWTWQIDHIKPHSTYNYQSMEDVEFKECWALENLRPLSSKQNFMDGVRRVRHKM